ncbi:hypothetical protein BD309DRAFT_446400 [Dichomitus squalens]|nr:hypothetical protein BD309DRAFT_446400 [Dichomitus squalens]
MFDLPTARAAWHARGIATGRGHDMAPGRAGPRGAPPPCPPRLTAAARAVPAARDRPARGVGRSRWRRRCTYRARGRRDLGARRVPVACCVLSLRLADPAGRRRTAVPRVALFLQRRLQWLSGRGGGGRLPGKSWRQGGGGRLLWGREAGD